MKKYIQSVILACAVFTLQAQAAEKANVVPADDPIGIVVESYFSAVFDEMGKVAAQRPTKDTFRELMKPLAEAVDGFTDGSFLDNKYVIQESYKDHIISPVGYDLHKQPYSSRKL
jgi:hypothetical protein